MTMARATVAGTLAFDAEKRYTQANVPVTVFTLSIPAPPQQSARSPQAGAGQPASDERYLVRVVCWRQLAEQAQGLKKGQAVLVEGKLVVNSFTAQDGQPRKQYEIEANAVMGLSGLPVALEQFTGAAGAHPVPAGYDPAAAMQGAPLAAVGAAVGSSGGTGTSSAAGTSDWSSDDFLTGEDDIPF